MSPSSSTVAPTGAIPASRRPRWALTRRQYRLLLTIIVVLGLGAGAHWAQGRGIKSRILGIFLPAPKPILFGPSIKSISPSDGQTAVRPDEPIRISVYLPNGGLDPRTLPGSVIFARADGTSVPITVEIAPDDGTLVLRPNEPLQHMTRYRLRVDGVRDMRGALMSPCTLSFTTSRQLDPSLRFEKVPLLHATGTGFTCVQVGPDQRLYASSDDGRILRFAIQRDGTLAPPQIIDTLQQANGGPRLVSGFCFDPSATAERPVIWISNSHFGFVDVPDWTGKITRLSGIDLETAEDIVVSLPRSVRDHLTHQPVFGPDGALYVNQGSNSACGGADSEWGDRPERLLSASILRLDVQKLRPGVVIDARTAEGGGSYNPFAADAPLTIYAHGVRVAYDLLWATNGQLYAPVNGASAGGNAPGSASAPALYNIREGQHDWLFRITPGRYYGHPNPMQGFFILNGGNPTHAPDPSEIPDYPTGTKPDSRWMPPAFDFGMHVSPNGIIQYRSDTFAGKLRGMLLVCRYNAGSDVIALELDDDGNVVAAHAGIPGFTDFTSPLDLAENASTGCIYVSDYGAQRIVLLRPME